MSAVFCRFAFLVCGVLSLSSVVALADEPRLVPTATTPLVGVATELTLEQREFANEVIAEFGSWVWEPVSETLSACGFARWVVIAEILFAPDVDFDELSGLLRPMLKTELAFLKATGEPSEEQFKSIVASVEPSLKAIYWKMAMQARQEEIGHFCEVQFEGVGDDLERVEIIVNKEIKPTKEEVAKAEPFRPRRLIRDQLVSLARETLNAEQFARYETELARRTERNRNVAIRSVVARLDADLLFSPDQREKFIQLLTTHWVDAGDMPLTQLMNDNTFVPELPEDQVFAILTDRQRETWSESEYHSNVEDWSDESQNLIEAEDLGDDEWGETLTS